MNDKELVFYKFWGHTSSHFIHFYFSLFHFIFHFLFYHSKGQAQLILQNGRANFQTGRSYDVDTWYQSQYTYCETWSGEFPDRSFVRCRHNLLTSDLPCKLHGKYMSERFRTNTGRLLHVSDVSGCFKTPEESTFYTKLLVKGCFWFIPKYCLLKINTLHFVSVLVRNTRSQAHQQGSGFQHTVIRLFWQYIHKACKMACQTLWWISTWYD